MLVFLFLLLAASDVYITIRMIREKGLNREANPFIRSLVKKFGINLGSLVGIALPTLAIVALTMVFHCTFILGVLVVLRLLLLYSQYKLHPEFFHGL